MKHLLKKISLIGAGSKPSTPAPVPPPPAKLEPPKIGLYNPHSSYSHAEIIDLICDGPIEALVNSDGKSLSTSEMFQGIYLDDAPIAQSTFTTSSSSEIFNDYTVIVTILKELGASLELNTKMTRASGFMSDLYNWYYRQTLTWGSINNYLFEPKTTQFNQTTIFKDQVDLFCNNLNVIYCNAFHQEYAYKGLGVGSVARWVNVQIAHEAPNLTASGGWTRINTNFTPSNINIPSAAGPSKLFYYKKNNTELHILGTQGLTGIMVNALNQLESIKNNTSINAYEREIIASKINKINSLYRKNWTSMGAYFPQDGTRYLKGAAPYLVIPITTTFDRSSFASIGLQSGSNPIAVENGKLINFSFYLKNATNINTSDWHDFIIPEINASNQFTGRVYGFVVIILPITTTTSQITTDGFKILESGSSSTNSLVYFDAHTISVPVINSLKNTTGIGFTRASLTNQSVKYNYNNILSEIKYGYGDQKPLAHFSKIYLDKPYKQKLIGPFRVNGEVRRFNEISNLLNPASKINPSLVGGNPSLLAGTNVEGSRDETRSSAKGSYTELQQTFNENAVAFTHIIENPETVSAIVSITVNELTDTLTKQTDIDGASTNTTNGTMEAPGTKIPAVVSIRIETGKQKGNELLSQNTYDYSIYGIISSAATIDFGNPDNDISKYNFISTPASQLINKPFTLPTLSTEEINSEVKRYIRVYKTSTETYSVLLRREIFIDKITEIVNSKFSYPFSAIVGSKIDARNLSSIPVRSFDCRLKKIKIPSNYNIIENGYDIRYQKKASDYNLSKKRIYNGDWNGIFKMGWTDNPAWILYDILISKRYGLGQYIDESQINVWELYKIARYCDAVDDEGYFQGVADGRGGLEPRFSCNVIFTNSTKLFDAINIIANLFRGSVFFSRSEVHFIDDRPREVTALFNNTNVKDGFFNYITNKKDEIFNTVEVAYLDRLDNFKTKIELVEDFEDIRQRGPLKTVVNTIGVTSKSMAKRIGRHVIWQTTKENEAVEFTAGLESLLCKPGDLIIIDDELRTRNINCGKVLAIDSASRTLTLSNPYDDVNFNGYIELYTPVGYDTRKEIDSKASMARNRMDFFIINGTTNSTINSISGLYRFSSYDENNIAKYTGYNSLLKQKTFCYYDNNKIGWIFSTGFEKTSSSIYDKVICYTSSNAVDSINDFPKYQFIETSDIDNIVGQLLLEGQMMSQTSVGKITNGGIYDDEIKTESLRQITKYQISGVTTNINDGSVVNLHANNFNLNLLSIVQPGSPYRIGVKSNLNQTYKIISIREQEQNEYLVIATKYDSDKWSAIENDNVIENPQQIFYDSSNLNRRIKSLDAPTNLFLDIINENKNEFDITGSFDSNHNNFRITVENKAVGFIFTQTTSLKQFSIEGVNDLGRYDLTVQAISTSPTSLNSYPAKIQKFIGYQKTDQNEFDRPYIETFKIL